MLAAVPWISGTSDRIRIFKHEAVIHLAPFEQGEIGPDLFRHACLMGLEGLVSKHRDSSIALVGSTLDQAKNRQSRVMEPVTDYGRHMVETN